MGKVRRLPAFIILIFIAILLYPVFIGAAAYTYDALHRLIRVDYDNGTSVQYFYDEVGNRIQVGGVENVVITASAGSNGSIYPSGTVRVVKDGTQTFKIIPKSNYAVSDVQVDGVPVEATNSYTFNNVIVNHTISASFLPVVSAITINPTSLIGGYIYEGTVILGAPAPSGGAIVSLSSSNPAVASVPATVTIAEGDTSAVFALNVIAVSSDIELTISASYGKTSQTVSLSILSPIMTSFALNASKITGGSVTQGTITLDGIAPEGGAIVNLSSSNPSVASVPAMVTVAAGATSATFDVTTASVGSTTSVTISASYAGGTLQVSLLVTEAGIDANTVLMLHMDGADNSTVFTDSEIQGISKPVTSNGAVITTAQFESGGASGQFNGTSYLTTPDSPDWDFGTGDFTIDAWVYTTDVTKVQRVFSAGDDNGDNTMYGFGFGAANPPILNMFIYTGGSYSNYTGAATSIQNNTWNHIAVVRKGTSLMGFVNGQRVFINTIAASLAFSPTGGPAQIGFRYYKGNLIEYVNGYLDELRVSKGVARWTDDFTPTASAYFSILPVSSVTFESARIMGGSATQGTVTLRTAAPEGGAVVSLSSNNPAVATVPATVIVAAGATSATFTVNTTEVSSTTTVTISASYDGGTLPVSLLVTEAGIDSKTVLMLHMDGADSSTVFNDSEVQDIPRPVTAYGASISTDQYTFGGASGRFNGTSRLTAPDSQDWNFGTSDFTIDAWVYTTDVTKVQRVFSAGDDNGDNTMYGFGFGAANPPILNMFIYTGGSYSNYTGAATSIQNNTWNHIAVVRNGASVMGFVNGQKVFTNIIPASLAFSPTGGPAQIGFRYYKGNLIEYVNGYLDELRVSKGIARWTDDFTPPATEYINILPVSSVTFEPASVMGGSATQGMVTLRSAAPEGGAVVSLSSNNSAVATVPATVTVAAGATGATFTVNTTAVSSATTVTISANYEGGTLPVPLSVSEYGIDPNVVLLLHMEGTDNSTVFTDSETKELPKTIIAHGPVISTAQYKFGEASGYFSGASKYLTVNYSPDFNLSTGDWTIDGWFNANSFASPMTVVSSDTYGVALDWTIVIMNSTSVHFYTNNVNSKVTVTVPEMTPGAWHHVAAVGHNGTVTVYLNGIAYGSGAMNASYHGGQPYITVGCGGWNNPNSFFNGYLDELRISKGIARWTSNFIPPGSPYASNPTVGVSFDPTIIRGGSAAQGTVTLDRIAPEGGAVVILSSSNPAVASVPATVTVPAGSSSATFSMSTPVVYSWTPVTITASYGGITNPVYLWVSEYGIDPNVVLLLHMDGTDNSTVFTDSETQGLAKTITALGPVISTAQDKFGGASGYFSGASKYLTVNYSPDFDLSPGDWTIDGWFNANSFASPMTVVSSDTYGVALDWTIAIVNSTNVHFYTNNVNSKVTVTVPEMSPGTWYHVAAVGHNGIVTVYLNGIAYGSGAMNVSYHGGQPYITVGGSGWNNPNSFFNGYLDELRISKGIARWTSNFTPPSSPYTGNLTVGISFDQASVSGGGTVQGTVTLNGPAPNGGAVVGLSSSNGAASVPATVTIPAGSSSATFTVTTNAVGSTTSVTISANYGGGTETFSLMITPSYTVTAGAGSNGSITPSGATMVNSGGSLTYTVTPDPGYHVTDVLVDGVSVGIAYNYTFSNVTANHSISVTFGINTYTITSSSGGNGTISCSPSIVNHGSGSICAMIPDTGYHITTVTGCGGVLSGNTYTTGAITADCAVAASFAINTYTVTPLAGTNGSMNPATPQTVNYNTAPTFTISPATGYHINTVSGCSGTLSGSTFTTGAITADCTITASFAINTFTVTPSAGSNGNISPATSQAVNYNDATIFVITPATGYHIATVTGCGGTLSGNTYTTGLIAADCSVSASFAIDTYTVTPSAGTNGSMSPSMPQTANYNSTTVFAITPATGYHIQTVMGCGGSLLGNTYTTGQITNDCTVTASFAINAYTVTPSSGGNGSINPAIAQTANYNSTPAFTVTPATGYHIAAVTGCGGSLSDSIYTTGQVTADCTITASFAINTYTVTPSVGANGSMTPGTAQTVNYNGTTALTITPANSYHIESIAGCGGSLSGNTYTTGQITADCTVTAIFAINTYIVSPSAGANGNISPATAQIANHGSTATFTVTPNVGYHIDSVTGCNGILSGNTFTTGPVMGDCTVTASFAINSYPITVSFAINGSITPASVSVNHGDSQVFSIAPDTGYHIVDVLIDGSSAGAVSSYTFSNVTAFHTIAVTFALNTYTVTPLAGQNGRISPNTGQMVSHGSTTSFTVTPNTGYHIDSVSGCGGALNGNIYTTGAVIGDCSVSVTFAINTYTVSMSAGAHGSIACTPATVDHGSSSTCTTTPDEGHHIVGVSVNGASVGTVSVYTITNVTSDATIEASFAINTYSIAANAEANGSITCTPSTVDYGTSSTCAITPDTGYHVADVLVDGATIGAVATYTFNNVTSDHSINVKFAINTYIVTPFAGSNGTVSCTPTTINHGSSSACILSPDAGYHIDSANGCGGTLSGGTYTTGPVTSDCTVSATFAINTYTVTPVAGANGMFLPATPKTVNHGATTAFTVTPNIGYHIGAVSGCNGSLSGNTFTTGPITGNCSVSANFAVNTYPLSVTKSGTGSGTVNSAPTGINCGTDCSEVYDHGTEVALTAIANAGSSFVGWSGACQGTAACTITMGSAVNVSAAFADVTPPRVTINATPDMLGPSDHKLRTVSIGGSADDDESGIASVVVTVIDEYGKYNMTVPGFGSTIQLEAWREGGDKDGRRYTITAVVTDRAGNKATASALVVVPHDMSGKKYDEDEDKGKHHDDYDKKDDDRDHHSNDRGKDKNDRDRHDEKNDRKDGNESGDDKHDKSDKKKDSGDKPGKKK